MTRGCHVLGCRASSQKLEHFRTAVRNTWRHDPVGRSGGCFWPSRSLGSRCESGPCLPTICPRNKGVSSAASRAARGAPPPWADCRRAGRFWVYPGSWLRSAVGLFPQGGDVRISSVRAEVAGGTARGGDWVSIAGDTGSETSVTASGRSLSCGRRFWVSCGHLAGESGSAPSPSPSSHVRRLGDGANAGWASERARDASSWVCWRRPEVEY